MAEYARSGFNGRVSREHPRVDYGANSHPADEVVERLAWIMDDAIPIGGGFRIGLDPLIGLIPGLGDLIGSLVASAIVLQAHRVGIPRATLLRMVANIGIDAILGAIPFLGDFFDFAFKANARNLKLYRESRTGVRDSRRDAFFIVILLAALGVIVAIPVLAMYWLVQAVLQRGL